MTTKYRKAKPELWHSLSPRKRDVLITVVRLSSPYYNPTGGDILSELGSTPEIRVKEATLYTYLSELINKGLISATPSGVRGYRRYKPTVTGVQLVKQERDRLDNAL
jgi:DNA-binding PadR family transcriptional regulator